VEFAVAQKLQRRAEPCISRLDELTHCVLLKINHRMNGGSAAMSKFREC
jgi:hypothetical protein